MATVQVACKLPNGLTVDHGGQRFTLNGANDPDAKFGFGYTDVDEELVKGWIEGPGATLPMVKNGSIFAMPTAAKAVDAAGERSDDAEVQTGLEPLDPEKPAPGIEPTDETRKALAKKK